MFAGMIIVPVVSLFTPKPDKELVDSAFACYEKETEVPQKTALGKYFATYLIFIYPLQQNLLVL